MYLRILYFLTHACVYREYTFMTVLVRHSYFVCKGFWWLHILGFEGLKSFLMAINPLSEEIRHFTIAQLKLGVHQLKRIQCRSLLASLFSR